MKFLNLFYTTHIIHIDKYLFYDKYSNIFMASRMYIQILKNFILSTYYFTIVSSYYKDTKSLTYNNYYI